MISRWRWYFRHFPWGGGFQLQLSKENFNQGKFNRTIVENSFYSSYFLFDDSILHVEILEAHVRIWSRKVGKLFGRISMLLECLVVFLIKEMVFLFRDVFSGEYFHLQRLISKKNPLRRLFGMIQKTIRKKQVDESRLGRIFQREWSNENSQRLFSARMEYTRGTHFIHLSLVISSNLSFPR